MADPLSPDRRPPAPRRGDRTSGGFSLTDLTPRGWLVGCIAVTLVLALLATGIGVLRAVVVTPAAADGHGNPPAAPADSPTSSSARPRSPVTSPAPSKPPSPRSTKSSRARNAPPPVPKRGPGTYRRATVRLANPTPRGRVIRYAVRVENGVAVDPDTAARFIHDVLTDKRSWAGDGSVTWLFTPSGKVDVTASITTPDTTDKLCRPLNTRGQVSCRNQENIALNAVRWTRGVPHFDGDLVGYRQYLVNHEFGHFLGHGHATCPGPGKKAPVMMTQTISLGKCRKNPWPANDP